MSTTPNIRWEEANQRHLMASLGVVRAALERHTSRGRGEPMAEEPLAAAHRAVKETREAMPAPPALEILCGGFGLSPFERDLLLLCAGPELDSSFRAQYATAQGDARHTYPTFSLALAALPNPHWSALTPGAPLRRWRLIDLANHEGLSTAPLRVDERILHFLAGVNELDDRLKALTHPLPASADLPSSHLAIARRIAEVWSAGTDSRELPVVQLCGALEGDRASIAAVACRDARMRLYCLRHAEIPPGAAERETLARLWEREAILGHSALLVVAEETDDADCARTLVPFLEGTQGVLLVSRREPLRACNRPMVRLDVPRPGAAEQRALWVRVLGESFDRMNGQVDAVVSQFNLGAHGIESACAGLRATSAADDPLAGAKFWEACRLQARPRLDNLAQRLEPAATWEDRLPDSQRQALREIAVHVQQRAKVYETWGFASKGKRGLGISALFAGPSGTGKTMAAEVLANELKLDVYRIDLSQVVSKYIGETEKNLRRVFDAAEEGGAILLFDEADALFGKRSDVKDSHDRYANIEVSYLLQRMEAYHGLAILTTNMKTALDTAFQRRIRFAVQFPFPDADRARIWQRVFPSSTPTEGLDVHRLARLNVPGGSIRNIALNAAFLAADAGESVRMNHLLIAARSEYAKMERPLTDAEVGGWE